MNTSFDIVIPVGPNDADVIHKQIEFTKANIVGYRKIYIIYCNTRIFQSLILYHIIFI